MNKTKMGVINLGRAWQDALINNFTGWPVEKAFGAFQKWRDGIIDKLFGEAPSPETSARRLQTSSWERMGLVLGAGGGQNYAKDTAANTKRIAEILSGRGSEKPAFNPGGMPMAFNGA